MDESQVTFDKLKLDAEYVHFEADHYLKRAAELDCISCLIEKKKKIQDAQEAYNALRNVVTQMTPLLSTNDANITKERAITRRKYDQACQDIRSRLMMLYQEIEYNTRHDTSAQQDSASSGVSSVKQSRTVRSESAFSADWSMDSFSFDGRVTSSASESHERAGSSKEQSYLAPHRYSRNSGGSGTSRTSSEAIPIPGTLSACNTPRAQRIGVSRFHISACLAQQEHLRQQEQQQHQQQSNTSNKMVMSYGSGDTVVARSLRMKISMSSDEEDSGPAATLPSTEQGATGVSVQSQMLSTTLQAQPTLADHWNNAKEQMHWLLDNQEHQESTDLNFARASDCQTVGVCHLSSNTPAFEPPSRDLSSSSSPLLSRSASHRPVPSYASIEQPASPASSSPSHCDQASLLHAGQAVAHPSGCCGRLHWNKVVVLVVVIIIQAGIIAGLILWKLYFP